MEDLIMLGRSFVQAMRNRQGFAHVDEFYSENAESVEAVNPPGRDVRIAKGKAAIKAKRQNWAKAHEILRLDADGPYVHPPNRFGVRLEAEVINLATGKKTDLREVAILSVQDGKIVREEFFMFPKPENDRSQTY